MERLYEGLEDYDEESRLYLDYKRVLEDLRDWLKAR
jgi:hypothetical protein